MAYTFHVHDLVSAPSGSGKLLPARILKVEGNELVVEFIAKQLRKVKVQPRVRACDARATGSERRRAPACVAESVRTFLSAHLCSPLRVGGWQKSDVVPCTDFDWCAGFALEDLEVGQSVEARFKHGEVRLCAARAGRLEGAWSCVLRALCPRVRPS